MNGALLLAILGPAAAAIPLFALTDSPTSRLAQRWIAAIGFEAGIGGAVALLIRALRTGAFATRGFEVDAWRAALVLGVLIVSAASLIDRNFRSSAATLAATSAAVASIFAEDIASFGVFLVLTTLGFAVAAGARRDVDAMRAAIWFAFSDLMAIAGLALIATDGMQTPPAPSAVGAGLLAVAVAIRCGVTPGSWHEDVAGRLPAAGIVLGAMRAQGFVIAGWLGIARGNASAALMVGGAVLAVYFAHRAARSSNAVAAQSALAAIVLAAIGWGAPAALAGAALLAAGITIGSTLLVLARERDLGSPSIGAAALGASFPGVAMIAVAFFERGIVDRPSMLLAASIAAAFAWLAIAGVGGSLVRRGADPSLHVAWSAPAVIAGLALFAFPGNALSGFAEHAARALGGSRTIAGIPGAITNDVGLVALVAGVVASAIAAVPLAMRARQSSYPGEEVLRPEGASLGTTPAIIAIVSAAAFGWLIVLVWVGIGRGFL